IAEADKTISENTDKIKEIEKNTATTPTAPKPTLPEGYDLDGTGGYTAMEEAQKATMELNKSYQIPAFNVQTNTTEADRNTTVDISNPISEQLKEINEYAAQVINDLRKQLGKPAVTISTNSINVVTQVAKQYEADNWFAFDNKGHDESALKTGAAAANSAYSSECIASTNTDSRYMTMVQIKQDIYEAITLMVFSSDELHHAEIILEETAQMGVTYSFFSNYKGLGDFAQIHFVFSVPLAGDTDANDTADYVTTYEQAEETAKAEQAKQIAKYQDAMIELLEYSNALEMTHIALTADIARTNTTIASNLTDVNQSVNTIKNLR
ncbi:SEC10/PgrA surface exclusion domain-containing protein, partial [Streptococcus alactolyticus]|uniref:SEC10/PgrA surface exclusion domain-containing protein n=1 Tax=Streptococcus alactolyticus TaxID=29389 RepID=UPI003BB5A051